MSSDLLLVPGVLDVPTDPDPSLYRRLLRDAQRSRRSPVLLGHRATDLAGELPMPPDPMADLEAADALDVLETWWPGPCPSGCHCLEPFEEAFPRSSSAAAGVHWSRHSSTVAAAAALVGDLSHVSTLAVVDAARPADIPIALGWAGMCNYRDRHLVGLCAVLRSWEERFGAVLVAMTFSTLVLAVAHPPRSQADAERLAAEHFAFCPDQHDPQNGIVYTPRTYGRTIRGADAWRFWWD
jgi:hypothetical protein